MQSRALIEFSDQHYRVLAEIVPVGIFRTDAAGHCFYVNERWCEITGNSMGEALGHGWADALHPEDRERVLGSCFSQPAQKPAMKSEFRLQRPNGRTIWVFGQVKAEADETGQITGYVGTITDFTQVKHSQKVLQSILQGTSSSTGLEFFHSLVRHICGALGFQSAMVGLLDAKTHTVRSLAVWDDGKSAANFTYHLAGTPCEQVMDSRQICFHPRGVRELFPEDQRLVEAEAESYLGTPLLDSANQAIGLLVAWDKRPRKGDASTQDILEIFAARVVAELERRNLETKAQFAEKLESLGVLAGGIAHDFNNLLVGILISADLALEEVDPSSPSVPYFKSILETAKRASALANQMLVYSGRGRFDNHPLGLNELITEVASSLHTMIPRGVTLQLDLARKDPFVEGDDTQLRQVVTNLVRNAVEALHKKRGTITLETGVLKIRSEQEGKGFLPADLALGDYAVLRVRDNGRGMDRDTRERIFDPFFSTKSNGRGLGMATVLGIIRGHQGGIRVESEADKGTCCHILLASSEKPAGAEKDKPKTAVQSCAGKIILVVDDESIVRDMARICLEKQGMKVLLASDGAEALTLFAEHRNEISVVLLDLTMPNMGGEETLRKMREVHEDVRVILTSGYDKHETMLRLGSSASTSFIRKPYLRKDLIAKISEVLAT